MHKSCDEDPLSHWEETEMDVSSPSP